MVPFPSPAMDARIQKNPENSKKFLVKLFSKSFRERRLSGKRRHPETLSFYQRIISG
ncbi:hypothetical protein LDL36_14775 [Komagataeibacter sp. FNDCR1]|nr:hypothetical protein [Komagataeibacter sp. FNDCR1]